jgi:hypothetical protein
MSCYFRHLQEIFDSSGIEITKDNRNRQDASQKLDEAMHKLLKVKYKDCPKTWKEIKEKILVDEKKKKDFAERLKKMVD